MLIVVICLFFIVIFSLLRSIATLDEPKTFSYPLVEMTKDGFKPKVLKIHLGETIQFVNNDTQPHWPASDHHPLHELYPEFDSKQVISKGKIWQFTFRRTGNWPYHDHLNPQSTGKIIVIGNTSEKTIIEPVSTSQSLRKTVEEVAKKNGPIAAWNYFKSSYNQLLWGSHDVAHYIGLLLYTSYGIEGMKYCDTSFAFGCYHGVIEGFINKEGIKNTGKLTSFCETLPFSTQLTCSHGVGHGILSYLKYNIPTALSVCDHLFPSAPLSINCYDGVFMENDSYTALTDDDNWPCNIVAEKYKNSCFKYQFYLLIKKYPNDMDKVISVCTSQNNSSNIASCIKGISDYTVQRYPNAPEIVIQTCSKLSSTYQYSCMISAAEEYVSERQPLQAAIKLFCSPLPDSWREDCANLAEQQKSTL